MLKNKKSLNFSTPSLVNASTSLDLLDKHQKPTWDKPETSVGTRQAIQYMRGLVASWCIGYIKKETTMMRCLCCSLLLLLVLLFTLCIQNAFVAGRPLRATVAVWQSGRESVAPAAALPLRALLPAACPWRPVQSSPEPKKSQLKLLLLFLLLLRGSVCEYPNEYYHRLHTPLRFAEHGHCK